MNINKVDKRK